MTDGRCTSPRARRGIGPFHFLAGPPVGLGRASQGLASSHAASFPAAGVARTGRRLGPRGPPSGSQAEAPRDSVGDAGSGHAERAAPPITGGNSAPYNIAETLVFARVARETPRVESEIERLDEPYCLAFCEFPDLPALPSEW